MEDNKKIYQYFDRYSKTEVDDVILQLDDYYKKNIYLVFGNNLEYGNIHDWTYKEQKIFFNEIIPKMNKMLYDNASMHKVGRKLQTIYEYLSDYSKEQIDDAISKLSDEDKYLIYLRYGNDLENPITSPIWSIKYSTKFYSNGLMRRLKKILSNERPKRTSSIYEYFSGYSKEEIDNILCLLSEEERKIIAFRYGNNFDELIKNPNWSLTDKKKFYNNIVPKMKRKLKTKGKNKKVGRKIESIYQKFSEYSKEEIDIAISKLSGEEIKLLYLRYGKDLENPNVDIKLEIKDYTKFYNNIIPKIRRMLEDNSYVCINGRRLQSIYEIIKGHTKEEIDIAISKLNEKELELLHLRYGLDLERPIRSKNWNSKAEARFYNNLLPKIRRILSTKDDKILTKSEYIKALNLLKTNEYRILLDYMSLEDAIIFILYFNGIDDKKYCVSQIAKYYNVEEEKIRVILNRILSISKQNLERQIKENMIANNMQNYLKK